MTTKKENVQWNLTGIFSGDTDPKLQIEEKHFLDAFAEFAKKWKENKAYLTEIDVLKEALHEYELLNREHDDIGKVALYWILRSVQNQSDEIVKAKKAAAINNALTAINLVSFFELELAKVSDAHKKLILDNPDLTIYKHYLEQLFAAAQYLLTEKEEKLILQKSIPANEKWVEMVNEFLAQETRYIVNNEEKRVKLGFEELLSMLNANIKNEVRDNAAKQITNIQKKLAPIATHELNAILLNKKIDDELRGMPRPDTSRYVEDDLDAATVDTLVSTITRNFSLPQRFYKLLAKLFGKKQLGYHERLIPFGRLEKKYTYSEAVEIVGDVFMDLDPEFKSIFDSLNDRGLIDPFPSKGKEGGGACYPAVGDIPPYIYMNFSGELSDLRTLAHECGHAINFVMSTKQNGLLRGHSKATAEVASTFMEDFVTRKLTGALGDKEKLVLLVSQLSSQVGSIFRQIALYNFETELHTKFREKLSLSQKEIGELFAKHMGSYMGDAVIMSEGTESWWVYWSHIRLFFYVYSYAGGHLISKAMQNKVREDKKFIEKVKVFLSAGQSKSPRDIFLDMGIDIADAKFWEDGLKEIEVQLNEAEKLAEKLGYLKK